MDDLLARLLAKLKLAAKKTGVLDEFDAIKASHVRCERIFSVWADAAEYAGYDLTDLRWRHLTITDGKVLIPIPQALHEAFEAFHNTMLDQHDWYLDFLDEVSAERDVLDKFGKYLCLLRHVTFYKL